MPDKSDNEATGLNEASPVYRAVEQLPADVDIDLTLLRDSLAKTPWERMQANDDALNFAESLRAAMETGITTKSP